MEVDGIRSELRSMQNGDRAVFQAKMFSLKSDVEAHIVDEFCPFCTDSEVITIE
jgi:hypothetical protein